MWRYGQAIRARNETGTLNPVNDTDDFGVLQSSSHGAVSHAPHVDERRGQLRYQHRQRPTLHHRRELTEAAHDEDEHDDEFAAILEQMQSLTVSEQQVMLGDRCEVLRHGSDWDSRCPNTEHWQHRCVGEIRAHFQRMYSPLLFSQIAERWGLSRSQKFDPVINIWSGDPAASAPPSSNPLHPKHNPPPSSRSLYAKHYLEEHDDREARQQLRRLDAYRLAFERCGHFRVDRQTFGLGVLCTPACPHNPIFDTQVPTRIRSRNHRGNRRGVVASHRQVRTAGTEVEIFSISYLNNTFVC